MPPPSRERRWVNLWLPLPAELIPDSCEAGKYETQLDGDGDVFSGNSEAGGEDDAQLYGDVLFGESEPGEDETQLDDDVFLGNTALVLGILLAIFLVHVTIISVVEAYWLAQVREPALSPPLLVSPALAEDHSEQRDTRLQPRQG